MLNNNDKPEYVIFHRLLSALRIEFIDIGITNLKTTINHIASVLTIVDLIKHANILFKILTNLYFLVNNIFFSTLFFFQALERYLLGNNFYQKDGACKVTNNWCFFSNRKVPPRR